LALPLSSSGTYSATYSIHVSEHLLSIALCKIAKEIYNIIEPIFVHVSYKLAFQTFTIHTSCTTIRVYMEVADPIYLRPLQSVLGSDAAAGVLL